MPKYLKKRGKRFHFQRRVPKVYEDLLACALIEIALDTDSEVVATNRANSFNLILEEFLQNLHLFNRSNALPYLQKLSLELRKNGYYPLSKEKLVKEATLSEFVNRINLASDTRDTEAKRTILDAREYERNPFTLLKAQEEYFEHEKGNLIGLSEHQRVKWENPRKKAVRNFTRLVGKKDISHLIRQDIITFRNWWINRVEKEGVSTNTVNKELGFIKQILRHAERTHGLTLSINNLFEGMRLKEVEKSKRYPFSNEFIQSTLMGSKLSGLNEEARLLIYAMIDTGARIGELVGLESEDIILNDDIPYIMIRPNETRTLKTPQSERDLPLVGTSLRAFQILDGTFDRYFGKSDLVSNTINKYFRDSDFLPSKNHKLYSLRHSFEDRLTAVEPPEKVQAALMGHKYIRPRYGDGPSLEQKRAWLDKIVFNV